MQNSSMQSATAVTPWRRKRAIMRWHSYQPLHGRARLNRNGRARPLGAPRLDHEQEHGHEHEHEHEQGRLYKRLKEAATGLLSDAVARTDRHSAWNEVFALVLLFSGTLLFFALISYTPKDVPSWIWFSNISPAN